MISVIIISTIAEQTMEILKNIELVKTDDVEEVIVVKGDRGELGYISESLNIKYINTNSEMYFSNLCNMGTKNTIKENDIFIVNDKVRLVNNTFENLQKTLYSNEEFGIVTPVSNIGPYYQSFNLLFSSLNDYEQYCKDKIGYETNLNEVILRTSFLAALIKRTVLNKIDGFDESFNTTEIASTDFCLRALKSGYKNLLCRHSCVYLKEEQSQYDNHYYIDLDKNKFKEKWNFDQSYCFAIRNEVINIIKMDKSQPIKVLEIGCSCGSTLLKIKQIYSKADLYGIEVDDSTSEIAKYISMDVKNIDIESDEVIFEDNFFDVVLALDVLEHLKDPWKAMKKIKKALKPNGQIIVSFPNIMNISIINNMIKGRWDYQDSGILDRTHLRFFTLKSIFELFSSIGEYYVHYLTIQYMPNQEEEKLINMLATIQNVNIDQLRAYQYIVTNK